MRELFSLSIGDFRVPDFARITEDDWLVAFEEAMAAQVAALDEVATAACEATLEIIHRWELSASYLNDVCNAFWTLIDADTTDHLDEIEAAVSVQLAHHADSIMLDRRLYDRLMSLQDRIDAGEIDADAQDRWWLSEHLRTFRRSGITLAEADQTRLKEINEQIASCESTYSAMTVKARVEASVHLTDLEQLAGLNPDQITEARRLAETQGLDGWVIELVNTTRQPLLSFLEDRSTRQRVFEASITRGQGGTHDVRETILSLIKLRGEKARLLGFDTYASYIADDGCAKTSEAVMSLLLRAATAAKANAAREAEVLQAQLDKILPGATLEPWDWAWLAEKTRKAQFDLDEEALKPYLCFETVLEEGVFAAATRLYGLEFHRRDDVVGYTDECRTYEVRDHDGTPLSLLFIDPYSRRTKKGGAWMTSLTDQGHLTGDLPVVTNNCNQTRPSPGNPSLMSWDEVTTLFHEFGHDLHGIFADTRYPSLSGTNTPRDFVEFPSQVNEMWAWEPSVISTFARHHATSEPLPDSLLHTLLEARSFGQGFDSLEIFAAMILDQAWHQASPEDLPTSIDEIDAFEKAALVRYGVDFDLIPPRYRSCYFSHMWGPGYSAAYYAYLWAEVMDADTVAWFEENGGLTRENGDRFRTHVLSRGGSEEIMEAYRRFRGTDPDPVYVFRRRGLVQTAS